MALYHFSVSQIKRSAGQSALAAAAYRAGERLYSEFYDEISDYTRKGGVLHTEILLPAHAPECFRDRATLWNAVEAAERHPKAQLAYSFDIALQNELSLNENIELARAFVQKEFVDRGMIADLAIHSPDKTGGIPNPHMHVMTTMRPFLCAAKRRTNSNRSRRSQRSQAGAERHPHGKRRVEPLDSLHKQADTRVKSTDRQADRMDQRSPL